MLDHMILTVSDVERSLAFYETALKLEAMDRTLHEVAHASSLHAAASHAAGLSERIRTHEREGQRLEDDIPRSGEAGPASYAGSDPRSAGLR